MATVSYTAVTDGDPRSAPAFDAIQTAIEAQTTNVDGENLRDEGLLLANINTGTVTDGTAVVEYQGGLVNFPAATGAYATLALGAQTFELTNGGVGWQVGQRVGTLRIRFSSAFLAVAKAYGLGVSDPLSYKLQYGIDGGAYTDIPASEVTFQLFAQAVLTAVPANGAIPTHVDAFRYTFLVPYPHDGAAHTLNKIRVQVFYNSVNVLQVGNSTLQVIRFIKSVH